MSNSCTECFYDLLDLSDAEKTHYLAQLQQSQPLVYQQLIELMTANEDEAAGLTELLEHSAAEVFKPVDLSGHIVGKYQLLSPLGQGGIGVVYSAERQDKTYKQALAIKFIQPALTEVMGPKALYQEAQLLALLNHPYIAKVFDAGEHQNSVYMVMERIDGPNLQQYLQQQSASTTWLLHLFTQLCDAIEHGHQNQIIHGDIKPENVLIDQRGNPKVLDFNITQKQVQQQAAVRGIKAFSRAYASPEQVRGEHLTQQSDLFSLGKLLSFLLTGGVSTVGDTDQTLANHKGKTRVNSSNAELNAIIAKATAEQPQQRYKSVTELRQEVENYLAHRPIASYKTSRLYQIKKALQRKPLVSLLSLSLVTSGLVFTALTAQQNQKLRAEQALTEDMVLELTNLVFHGKAASQSDDLENMLELTRRRIMSNQDLPLHLKQKMLMAILTPVPAKKVVTGESYSNSRMPPAQTNHISNDKE